MPRTQYAVVRVAYSRVGASLLRHNLFKAQRMVMKTQDPATALTSGLTYRPRTFPGGTDLLFRVFFVATVCLLGFLFTWRISEIPLYLNQDEAGFGLATNLLGTTGRDYFGIFLPTYIRYFDSGQLANPITIYLGIPFVDVLGLSIESIRLSSSAFALLGIVLFGALGWELTENRWASLSGVWLLALSPLYFIEARIFLDPLYSSPFVTGWLLCIVLFEKTKRARYLVLAAAVLGIGMYSYTVCRMLMPAYLAVTLAVYWLSRRCSTRILATTVSCFAVLAIPAAAFAYQNPLTYAQRFATLTWMRYDWSLMDRLVAFASHYISHFDPSDLFLTGDSSLLHSTGSTGVVLLATLPLCLIGGAGLLRSAVRLRSRLAILLILALIFFPVPTAFLEELHRPVRAAHMLPIYAAFCVIGLDVLLRHASLKWATPLLAVVGLAWVLQASLFLSDYFAGYPLRVAQQSELRGNSPLAYRVILEERGVRDIYVDRENSMSATYAGFFQAAYNFRGTLRFTTPDASPDIPTGALLLTGRPNEFGPDFQIDTAIPELDRRPSRYFILRKRSYPRGGFVAQ